MSYDGFIARKNSGSGGLGSSGYSGYSGRSGFSGFSGSNGTGAPGSSGFSGYSGIGGVGVQGLSGFSGYSGASGFSGYSGVSGFSGHSGKSGFSGYSGMFGGDTHPFMGGFGRVVPGEETPPSGWLLTDAPLASSSTLYISVTNGDGATILNWLLALDDSTNATARGFLRVVARNDSSKFVDFAIIGAVTNSTTYVSVPVSVVVSNGTISDSTSVLLTFARAGDSGFSGYSGRSGFSGYSGSNGTGASGFSGYSGISGFSGYSGISGFSGYSGKSGFSGYSGATAASGYSGYSAVGTSGYSAYSGAAGASGFSGYSGASPSVIAKVVTADQTVSNTITTQAVTDLPLTIGANETWLIEYDLYFSTNAAGSWDNGHGIKFSFTNPTSPTSWQVISTLTALDPGAGTNQAMGDFANSTTGSIAYQGGDFASASQQSATAPTWGADIRITLRFTLFNGANSGTHQIKFAQVSATTDTITLKKGSSVRATKV